MVRRGTISRDSVMTPQYNIDWDVGYRGLIKTDKCVFWFRASPGACGWRQRQWMFYSFQWGRQQGFYTKLDVKEITAIISPLPLGYIDALASTCQSKSLLKMASVVENRLWKPFHAKENKITYFSSRGSQEISTMSIKSAIKSQRSQHFSSKSPKVKWPELLFTVWSTSSEQ